MDQEQKRTLQWQHFIGRYLQNGLLVSCPPLLCIDRDLSVYLSCHCRLFRALFQSWHLELAMWCGHSFRTVLTKAIYMFLLVSTGVAQGGTDVHQLCTRLQILQRESSPTSVRNLSCPGPRHTEVADTASTALFILCAPTEGWGLAKCVFCLCRHCCDCPGIHLG